MPHAPSRRRGATGDIRHHGDPKILAGVDSSRFLRTAADLADENNAPGPGILPEEAQGVDEARADDGIAPDSDAGALPDATGGELRYSLVGQSAAAGDDSHFSRSVDGPGHDPHLALSWSDDPRAIGANEPGAPSLQKLLDANHVQSWNTLGDTHHQGHLGVGGLHDRVGSEGRRDEDHRRVGARLRHRFGDCVEDHDALVGGSAFSRCHPGHHLRAVDRALLGVKGTFSSGDSLHQEAGIAIHKDAHAEPFARATTLRAASCIPSATVKLRPEPRRMPRPSSTLVPSSLTTIGTLTPILKAESTTPWATTSQRMIPPNMLISTAFTLGSERRIRKALETWSVLAPPPTSRKLAGVPPAS